MLTLLGGIFGILPFELRYSGSVSFVCPVVALGLISFANITKVESRSKVYFDYAETKTYLWTRSGQI